MDFRTGGGLQGFDVARDLSTELPPGTEVGPYVIDQTIGQGGMGVVYRAHRSDGSFDQTVALKLVRSDADLDATTQRFLKERQILAQLNHPNIARLLDGGTLNGKAPFFVMEFIEGQPIGVHCQNQRLGLRARLQLFLQVLDAVDCAHRRLVVHRDIKPNNILVDAEGCAKLLDFGIAKVVEENVDQTALTAVAGTPLTLAYASPEQVRGLDINLASDIYQLGLILYELLTSERWVVDAPTDPIQLMRLVAEDSIPAPSETLKKQQVEGRLPDYRLDWPRHVRGDLDAIVGRACEKDPERRYRNVLEFADDIYAFLEHRPVRAKRGGRLYRWRKFAHRHAAALAVAATGGLAIATFAVYHTQQLAEQRDIAVLEAAKTRQVVDFLTGLFESADPDNARGEELSVREVLDQASERFETGTDIHPDVQASLRMTLGKTYFVLGHYESACDHLEQARLLTADSGPAERFEADFHSASCLWQTDQLTEAKAILQPWLAEQTTDRQKGLVNTRMADIALTEGQPESALAYAEQALSLLDVERDPIDYVDAMKTAAFAQRTQGQLDAAAQRLRAVLDLTRQHHAYPHREIAGAQTNLANVLSLQGHTDEAELLLLDAREQAVTVLGEQHSWIAAIDTSIGIMAYIKSDFAMSAEAFERARQINIDAYGPNHSSVATVDTNLAAALIELDDLARAVEVLEEGRAIISSLNGADSPALMDTLQNLILAYRNQERYEEAWPHVQTLLAITEANSSQTSPLYIARHYDNAAHVAAQLGRNAMAMDWFEQSIGYFVRAESVPEAELVGALQDAEAFIREHGDGGRADKIGAMRVQYSTTGGE